MLKILIEKELKEILGSAKFIFTFVVCSLLILLTFYVGARNYQISRSQYEASVAENMRSMQEVTDWRMVQHKIFLPPLPLASLVGGVSNDVGREISMAGLGELVATGSKYNEDPIYAVFRFLDLDFLFQIILSLFAILFTYNAVNGEKEGGTLGLTFANPVPRDKYILGKLIGSFTALAVPLLIPMLLGSLLLPALGVPMAGQDWMKLIFVIFTGFLYFGVFLTLSVFMSVVMKQSSGSFLIMLVIWIMSVVVLPRASVIIAGRAVNVPSVDEINSKKAKFSQQMSEEMFKKMATFKGTGEGQTVMQEFQKFMGDIQEENSKQTKENSDKLNEERSNRQTVQQNLAFGISRVSPSACFSLGATNMAGTSLQLINEFTEQAVAYQAIYKKFQMEKTGSATGGGLMITVRSGEEEKKINPKELPQFTYNPPEFNKVLGKSIIDIMVLIIYNLIFFFGSFIAFLKYDLR
jgi:ABC-type transport system involved in multi-copper enzyme maturation permease subunit